MQRDEQAKVFLRTLSMGMLLCIASFSARGEDRPPLTFHKMDQPYCPWQLNLDVGRDQFVEAANKLPGRGDYNGIIRSYRAARYEDVEDRIRLFRQVYETSPFNEALDFLEVQMGFEQAEGYDDPKAVAAERKLRNVAILYPKSDFLAPVSGNMASYWLKSGRFQRSLALYQKLGRTYSGKQYQCVFQAGVAESHFQLNQWGEAKAQYEQVLLTCKNRRLFVGGLLRLGDLKRSSSLRESEEFYKQARKDGIPLIDRHYQESLYNMGEVAYRRGRYASAGHFFTQFLKVIHERSPCIPGALKRKADSAVAAGEKVSKVLGLYLGVKDKVPDSDVGRSSYLHALLLTLLDKNEIERQRRFRIIKEELPKIKDRDWYHRIESELNLVELALGNLETLDNLERLSRPKDSYLRAKKFQDYIADQAGKVVASGGLRLRRSDTKEPLDYLKSIESIFNRWASKGKYGVRAGDKYAEIVLEEARRSLALAKPKRALSFLKYWAASPMWKIRSIRPPERRGLVEASLRPFFDTEGKPVAKLQDVTDFEAVEKDLEKFMGRYHSYLDFVLAARTQDPNALKSIEVSPSRFKRLPKELKNFVLLDVGRALREQGKSSEAAKVLSEAMDGPYRAETERQLVGALQEAGEYASLLSFAKKRLSQSSGEYLVSAAGWALAGKLWGETGFFEQYAKRDSAAPEVLRFVGRASFEKDKCEEAIAYYKRMGKDLITEDQYRLGKCLVRLDRGKEAREALRPILRSKDKAWRELARIQIGKLSNNN